MQKEPRTPQQSRSIATKEQLFQAALELFSEDGYHRSTSKKIAARAGFAVGSFYAYYRNKKEVFLEVIQHYYGRILNEVFSEFHSLTDSRSTGWQNSPAAGSEEIQVKSRCQQNGPALVSHIIRRLYEAHNISPQLHREITGMRYTDPEVDRLISEEEQKTVALIHNLLGSLQPLPEVEDLEAAAHIIHRASEEVIHSIKIFGSPIEAERLLKELNAMLAGYLFGEKPDF
jgi:AcrR family transcriptional regulator